MAVALAAACVAAAGVTAPPAAWGQTACVWTVDVLPLPHNTIEGRVTAGDGDWLAGETGTGEAVLWRRGRLVELGRAFGLDTNLTAVNPDGVAVGHVTAPDGTHAVRYRGGFEYLPGGSTALDVNPEGVVVGYDGPTLVLWTVDGTRQELPMPPGEHPFGRPSVDDDGTVVARTGKLDEDGTIRWRVHAWAPDGTRRPLPASDGVMVTDARRGRMVGSVEPNAVLWARGDRTVLLHGTNAVAVNADGTVVGVGPHDESLIWPDGRLPRPLPPPWRHHPGTVTAVNDAEAGGYAFPPDDEGSVPVRWRCRVDGWTQPA